MHLNRWITAIIAVPFLVFVVGYGPRWSFYVLLCAAAIIGIIECYRIIAAKLPKPLLILNCTVAAMLFLSLEMRQIYYIPAIILLWGLLPMGFFIFTRTPLSQDLTAQIGKSLLALVYVALPLSLLAQIHFYPMGRMWVFFLLIVVFAGDTGAFYAGRLFGKHKLHKRVSPGKTWEGAFGGLIMSLGFGSLFLLWRPIHRLSVDIFILMVILSAAAQIGDLAESLLKRNHRIKDSGTILPGHGGVLDRIDGLLFAIPVLFVYLPWQ